MRAFIGIAAAAGIIGAVVLQKQRVAAPEQRPAVEAAAAAPVSSKPAPAAQPSGHNWPKSAVDRAADVKRQVAEQRKGDETR